MTTNHTESSSVERIIAKIDNDFNPDNSDWIPRVGAWCIDAMSQLDVLRTKKQKKKLTVQDRIAYSTCPLDSNITVYDSNGCEVKEASDSSVSSCCGNSSDDDSSSSSSVVKNITPSTIDVVSTGNGTAPNYVIANTINEKYPYRYNVQHYIIGGHCDQEKTYVLADCNKIEINFDDDYIYVETEYIETKCNDTYGCELPTIPNNGLLIEAIAYYCMYKMLCRGYKHPVFNLSASQYGTNPYYMWTQLKDEAKRSLLNGDIGDAGKLFRSTLFIDTFDPRN